MSDSCRLKKHGHGVLSYQYTLMNYTVDDSEDFLTNLFHRFSTRFMEDLSLNLEGSEIRCEFVL